tara:strand:+ start:114 stop:524 length:411 start_codon:yes stop_codon:yes gene_type:complete
MKRKSLLLVMAGILGCLGVILGATGKHALEGKVDEELSSGFETGLRYHQTHGVALLAVTLFSLCLPSSRRQKYLIISGWLIFLGIVVFSGSLYLMAFTGILDFGKLTPVGGILLILGWLSLALVGFFEPKPEANSP